MLLHQPLLALTATLLLTAATAFGQSAGVSERSEKLLRVRIFSGKKEIVIRALSLNEVSATRRIALVSAPVRDESVEVKI